MSSNSVSHRIDGDVMVVAIDRQSKRNALDDATVLALEALFNAPPAGVRAAVLFGEGDNFSAGLDLSELRRRDSIEAVEHSRMWHRAFERLQFGRVPIVACLRGAVIGGGLELACATHVRVAEPSAYYALPEGQRGIYVGGGASARLTRLIGVARMSDLMLTGRVYDADEGHAVGISQYRVGAGDGLAKSLALAQRIAQNAPISNFAVMHALPRIADSSQDAGLFTESLMAAIASGSPEAQARLEAFLAGRAPKVAPNIAAGAPSGASAPNTDR